MAIDIGQFVQTFFEESFEGLDVMEAGLLALQPGAAADLEQINTIFRAAHSIKGGSGTFGFQDVTRFTHLMETLLDGMREGRMSVTSEAVNTLLESVDCLREMLVAARENAQIDDARVQELRERLTQLLERKDTASAGESEPAAAAAPPPVQASGWRIAFRPHPQLMHSGNDPVRMFRELAELGELAVRLDASQLPRLAELKPEDCYLAWELELLGAAPREAVADVFAWVEGDCELSIEPLAEAPTAPAEVAKPAADSTAKPPPAGPAAGPATGEEGGQQGELLLERRKGEDRRRGDRRTSMTSVDSGSIRVGIDKVDAVINLVGELVTTQSMLSALGEDFDMSRIDKLHEALDQLDRNTRDLQEHVMRIRMLPVSSVFSRFPRMVHDISGKLGKQVELRINGEQTELDKTVIEKIGDPLVHLIRNSLDHGLEPPEERVFTT